MHGVGRIGLICRAVIEGIIHWNRYRIIEMMRALTYRYVGALRALRGNSLIRKVVDDYDKISGL